MATIKFLVFVFAILVPSTIIFGQETTESGSSASTSEHAPPATSSASRLIDHFPSIVPDFDFSSFWPDFNISGFLSGRGKRAADSETENLEEHSREKRSVIRCNFFTQGGFRCTGCREVRRCYPFNLGTITTCGGIFPYCRNGICSHLRGSLCDSTTSTNSTSTNSTSTNSTSTNSTSSGSGSNSTAG